MTTQFARRNRTTDDDRRAVDVSGVETCRVSEYVGERFPDADDVYLERKGGRTLLVTGE